ncbi:MAG: UDP-N-acetylmuramate--alanine ligase [Chloroflexota bacterium]|jgi:UDP-N-acetylmuramate--alanine ligase|nr:UDP-N-acetylmuramate--alanine ligase [Chloroflexota bacterium]
MTRTVADIARGLEPARPARPIAAGERIHVVGAAGSAASASLLLAHAAGAAVSGCDSGESSRYSAAVVAAGIPLTWSHDPGHVVDEPGRAIVDRIAVSKALTAVAPDQPELRAARAAGIPAISCQQLIADAIATRGGDLLAVAGTHGKSTATGWLVHMLVRAGIDPSAFVGAVLPPELTGSQASVVRLGRGRATVVEADEYAGNFDPYRPDVGVLLNADWDHPDVFATRADVVAAFEGWIRRFRGAVSGDGGAGPPTLVANAGDVGVAELLPRLVDWPGRLLVFAVIRGGVDAATERLAALRSSYRTALGPAEGLVGRYEADPDGTARLVVHGLADRDAEVAHLRLVGRHNAEDGLGAAGGALAYGADPERVLDGLRTFSGVDRRFELKGEAGGVVVLDDYGHHPTAIAASLDAVELRYPGRRVWAVYEPLTFHRTAAMLEPFADVLARADRVAIADIFAVRDPDTTIVSAADLAAAVSAHGTAALAPGSAEATADALAPLVESGDVVLVMGGGRSSVIAERLVKALADRP